MLNTAMAETLSVKPKSHRDTLMQQHRLKRAIDQSVAVSKRLCTIYADSDGTRKDELTAMTGSNSLELFYERLRGLRDQHRKYPVAAEAPALSALPDLPDNWATATFSGEEALGRYVDLNAFHPRWEALAKTPMEYGIFLQVLDKFHTIEREKKGAEYHKYVEDLLEYLSSFYKRTRPLADINDVIRPANEAF